ALMVQQTPLAVIEWNRNFEIKEWNQAAERIFGYSKSEVLGRDFSFLVTDDFKISLSQMLDDFVNQKGRILSTNENVTKDGRRIICEWYNYPLVAANGEIVGIASMAFDITERKQAETELYQKAQDLENTISQLQRAQTNLVQSEKMSGLGQLVAGVAHEINNPVNFIYGNLNHANNYIQNLLEIIETYRRNYPQPTLEIQELTEELDLEFLVEDLPKLLGSMKVGAQRIREIVASLRNFSRMDEAQMKQVNIHEGIDSTLMILEHRIKAKPNRPRIEIIKNYSKLPQIECYPGQLNQVFMNILVNALDALEKGIGNDNPPTICIKTELLGCKEIKISISDNGKGIPEKIKTRLFDPFFTTKPVGKGTGMGLSISYQIVVEKHCGSLDCISAPGEGTEFVITIPMRQCVCK
ncbi:MAG: ATP-binding protein, partial [Cyanobacteria bacterium P01_C01_bin.38]